MAIKSFSMRSFWTFGLGYIISSTYFNPLFYPKIFAAAGIRTPVTPIKICFEDRSANKPPKLYCATRLGLLNGLGVLKLRFINISCLLFHQGSSMLSSYLTRQLCQQRMQRLIIYSAYDCPQKCCKSLRDMIAVELNYWFYNFFWWPNGTSQVCVTLGATASNCLFAVIKIYATAIPMVVLPHLAERLNPKPECPRFKSHPQFFGQ